MSGSAHVTNGGSGGMIVFGKHGRYIGNINHLW